MPDLQSELSKLANAWDNHEQAIRQPQPQQEKAVQTTPVTGNATRDTFEFIRLNSRKYTQVQLADGMARLGYKKNSVQALMTQMKRNGMIQLDPDGRLFTTLSEYKAFSNPYKANPVGQRLKTKRKGKRGATSAGIAALAAPPVQPTPPTLPNPNPARLVRLQTAAEVLANLSVAEAHKLYVELGKLFGGK